MSPVTLRRRFNPHACGEEAEPEPGRLPDTVDSRQPSLLGAAWTVGSVKYLAEPGRAGRGAARGPAGPDTLRRLNDETAPDWSAPQALEGISTLELGPYGTVRVDG